jgi:hypothetical protein
MYSTPLGHPELGNMAPASDPNGAPKSRPNRAVLRRWLACLVAAHLATVAAARAGELCQFRGTSDYSGQVTVTTKVDTRDTDGATIVDVTAGIKITPMLFIHVNYLMEEISTWKSDQLQSVAVNSRYIVDSHVVRQEWDLFDRGADGLEAYRLQGKTLDDLRRKHPAFVRHWDPANFGQPWVQDYRSAGPERRADLDLPGSLVRPDLRSPLALAFYWSRRTPPGGQGATVFLPGFKRDKRIDLTITEAEPPRDGRQLWQTSIRYPALSATRASTAEAWVSMDRHLLQLAVSVQSGSHTAYGFVRQVDCHGTAGSSNDP